MKLLYENLMRIRKENEARESAAEFMLADAIATHFDIPPDSGTVGSWQCTQSPIGVCVYDSENDFSRDDCVICHQPAERL